MTQWTKIERLARKKAAQLCHNVGPFHGRRSTPGVRTALCETCGGCCWVANIPDGPGKQRKGMGGRLLFFACGTPEAAGFIRQPGDALLPGGAPNPTPFNLVP